MFSKAGVSDPLKQRFVIFMNVLNIATILQEKVYRLKYSNLNIPNRVQPISGTLLENVDQFKIVV